MSQFRTPLRLPRPLTRAALLLAATGLALAPTSALAKTKEPKTLEDTSPPMELPSPPWQIDASPTVAGSEHSALSATFVASASDAWAVGEARIEGTLTSVALAEEWTGSEWKVVPTADLDAGSDSSALYGVSGTGPDDVWAVGANSGSPTEGLIEHWNGTSWSAAAPANGEPASSTLLAVSADSPSDAWAVGTSGGSPLIEHYDGSSWGVVKGAFEHSKNDDEDDRLIAVDALSPTDVWALGTVRPSQEDGQPKGVVEHFDGRGWSIVRTAKGRGLTPLRAISAVSPSDIWAVGQKKPSTAENREQPALIEHWNGSQWSLVPSGDLHGSLTGVAALSATDAWAVGAGVSAHWNGTTWTAVPFPSEAEALGPRVESVSGIAGGPLFAVGSDNGADDPLILQQPTP
jgi:hypothetical protein